TSQAGTRYRRLRRSRRHLRWHQRALGWAAGWFGAQSFQADSCYPAGYEETTEAAPGRLARGRGRPAQAGAAGPVDRLAGFSPRPLFVRLPESWRRGVPGCLAALLLLPLPLYASYTLTGWSQTSGPARWTITTQNNGLDLFLTPVNGANFTGSPEAF